MRRTRLAATALISTAVVSAVVGTLLALLAPAAAADGTDSSPGNRGWVADHGSFDDNGDD